jgi:phosphatidylglycerophosphatase A
MKSKFAYWLATCSYIGCIPVAPGTFGSLAAIPALLLLNQLHYGLAVIFAPFTIWAIWASGAVAKERQLKDPQEIVVDEFCGMLMSFLFVPVTWTTLVIGFGFFRLFDIFKPLFIRRVENIRGGFGIVLDDVLAGLYTNLILQLVVRYAHL